MTAAERFAAWALALDLDERAAGRRRGREAARARRPRLRARRARARHRRRGPHGDGGARRRAGGVGDRARRRAARGERRLRQRDALPRPRLRRHALRLGVARLHGRRAGRARGRARRAARAAASCSRRSSPATRSSRASAWRRPAPSTSAASTRPRSAGSSARRPRPRASRGLATADAASALGIAGSMALGAVRVPRRRHRDEADPSRLGGARRAARGAAGGARRRGACRACSEGRFGVFHAFVGTRHRPRAAARRPRRAVGDAADRVQAVPGVPLHPRLARGDRIAPRRPRPRRDRGRRRDRARAGRARSCSSRRRRRWRRAPTTRASSASSTRPRRCSSTAASASATYTPEALADPRVLGLARKVRYETKEYASYPAAFPGGVLIRLRDGRTLEADMPHQLGAPGEPDERDAGAREVPRERGLARRRPRAAGGDGPGARGAPRTCAGCSPRQGVAA